MTDNRDRFQQVYIDVYADLVRFVIRRRQSPEQAEDLVAEACTIAWQRLDDLPKDEDQARAWLFGITRNLLLGHQRIHRRDQALLVHIAGRTRHQVNAHEDLVSTSIDLIDAWKYLSAVHQEALSLTLWEGMSGAQAAQLLGISAVAFRIRLSRARRELRHHLHAGATDSHTTNMPSHLKGRAS